MLGVGVGAGWPLATCGISPTLLLLPPIPVKTARLHLCQYSDGCLGRGLSGGGGGFCRTSTGCGAGVGITLGAGLGLGSSILLHHPFVISLRLASSLRFGRCNALTKISMATMMIPKTRYLNVGDDVVGTGGLFSTLHLRAYQLFLPVGQYDNFELTRW